jgi:hypothetical protein
MGSSHLGSTDGYNPVNSGIPKFTVGDSLSVNHLQAVARNLDRATISSGNGYQVRRYSNSTVIQANNYVAGGQFRNFQVFGYVDTNDSAWITVSIGTVNRAIPKIGTLYMDQVQTVGDSQMQPRIPVSGDGYIVIEATYDSNKPFPSVSEIKFVSQLETDTMKQASSQYPLASIKYKPANAGAKTPAEASVSQIHSSGNLAVSRVKVGSSKVYWQWWRI